MQNRNRIKLWAALFASAAFCAAVPCAAQDSDPAARRAFFGELHLHTTMSLDAWSLGTKITPDQAYKFGRGETVMVPAAQIAREEGIAGGGDVPAKRAWALDFMAVTDHSEGMGTAAQLDDPNSAYAQSAMGRQAIQNPFFTWLTLAKMRQHPGPDQHYPPDMHVPEAMANAWDVEQKAANDNYEPGIFTTFIAYEWSSNPDGKNLHRNVIFNTDRAPKPFSAMDSDRPEDLWSYLETARANGIDVIAIPHNGNASGGLMYDWNDSDGRPIDEAYAQRRALNEPLTEIVQNKGQSDTTPELSPNDEFANFEVWDHLLASVEIKSPGPGSYIRNAFGRGLVIQSQVGANPYKYGVVGASDIHNGLSASDESAMAGGAFGIDNKTMLPRGDAAKRLLGMLPGRSLVQVKDPALTAKAALDFSSAGITGVWAEQNDRASIFAALKRKETFATSGTRIRVRMFGGWNFDSNLTKAPGWVATAYATGVAMGGDLPANAGMAKAPTFAFWAIKDPDGANLDRIQVIKLWLEGNDYKEKIFDVALSNDRKVDPNTGKARAVGNTVDLKTGKYTNTIGATELSAVWRDPEFDASKAAVYYTRVLEIPTPRWSTLLAIANGLPIPTEAAATIQERAWTSPIWYTPKKG